MGVFVSEVSSPRDWVRQRIVGRPVQAAGIVPESSKTRTRLPVDDENAQRGALDAPRVVSVAASVDQWVLVDVVSVAALDDPVRSEEILHTTDHE